MLNEREAPTSPPAQKRGLVLLICYLGFVSLGLPDPLIGVAWPSIRRTFALDQGTVAWIFFGSGCSYFVSSFFAGRLLKLVNLGALLAFSSVLVALSGFDYSFTRVWPLFVFGSLLHGFGSGAIDAGLNHYVASHFSARQMNWLHACYSFGAMLGPLIMSTTIARAHSWRLGYAVVAGTLLALSLLFLATRSKWNDAGPSASPGWAATEQPKGVSTWAALHNRLVCLHIALFFVYTGLEVAIGQWSFTVLTESRAIRSEVAGLWVAIYWGAILAGRIVFGFVVDRIRLDSLIRISIVAAMAGTALFAWNPTPLMSPLGLGLAGLGLAVIFPCLMTRTPQRLGKGIAAHAIGFQVSAAMLGAAALPSLCAIVAQYAGVSFVAPAILAMAATLFALHEVVLQLTSDPAAG